MLGDVRIEVTHRRVSGGWIAVAALACGVCTLVGAAAPTVPVTRPSHTGSRPNAFNATIVDLAPRRYIEQEFLVEGTADGRLEADSALESKPYLTRILVRRPRDAKRFNGTVLVEWVNVSGGYDIEIAWPAVYEHLMRAGYAWVGVTAQPVGVNFLKAWDLQRYGTLVHPGTPPPPVPRMIPGETYSFDIFSQAGAALRHPNGADPLGGLKVQRLIAHGQSQSAGRLTAYLNNGYQQKARVYDAFMIHSGGGALTGILDTPVLKVGSEAEVLGYFPNRQEDGKFFRYWEVAGTSHTPRISWDHVSQIALRDQKTEGPGSTCEPQRGVVSIEYALRAAVDSLDRWVRTGTPPAQAERVTVVPGSPPAISRDKFGNALGGVRLPHVEAPSGRHLGTSTPEACRLFPGYVPFDAATMASVYASHGAYVEAVKRAATRAVKSGFLLEADAKALREEAAASSLGKTSSR